MSGKSWTVDEDSILRDRYPAGKTKDIAVEIGRSERSIYMHAFHLGLKKSPELFRLENADAIRSAELARKILNAAYKRRWVAENPDRIAAINKRYNLANPEKVAARQKRYRAENPEKSVARKKAYQAANSEKIAAATKRYLVEHRAMYAAHCAKRYAAKLHATPSWAEPELPSLSTQRPPIVAWKLTTSFHCKARRFAACTFTTTCSC